LALSRSTTPSRILLAEDDAEFREMLVDLLQIEGYEVVAVRDGAELRAHLEAWQQDPQQAASYSLILSDLRMPNGDALQVLESLGARRSQTPVLLMSAFADEELHERARRAGVVGVLGKPFDVDDLRTVLYNLTHATSRSSSALRAVLAAANDSLASHEPR